MFNLILTEHARNYQFGFQVPASPVMEGILNFHHDLFFFLISICGLVVYMLGRTIVLFNSDTIKEPIIVTHAPWLEIVWTLIPAIILVFVAVPSFSLLYSMDEIIEPLMTIKIIGHQWYWSYEFLDPNIYIDLYNAKYEELGVSKIKASRANSGSKWWVFGGDKKVSAKSVDYSLLKPLKDISCSFDSYMITDEFLKKNQLRLLSVDNKLYLPVETNIRLLVTAADVIHSWAVPALGIKLDGCPGRLNQTSLYIKRPGTFYGQCSEICGVNHGFMPIAVVGLDVFGKGTKLNASTAEAVLPIFTTLMGRYYEKNN
jgi:cytochrome c oxidase subunit 2